MRHNLCIPFERKDEIKKDFKIRWDAIKKVWYYEEDLPEELKKYELMIIDISYDDKDMMKKKFKSMRFDRELKSWTCSMEDYNKIYKGK